MALVQLLVSSNKYGVKCPYEMKAQGICIHNTANDASARNEISYMHSNNNEVSYHIAVDDKEAIQGLPLDRNAWHAGDGGSGQGNRNYIAVEICYSKSGGDRFIKAEKRAAIEVASLLNKYGWTVDNVRDHRSFSGKNCPHRTNMFDFKYLVQVELNKLNKTPNTNEEMYRVRKSWDAPGTQKGAFKDINNAKKCANENKGYNVYDKNGNKVYPSSNTTPTTPKPEASNKRYLNLHPHNQSWRIYKENGPYTTNNSIAKLAPSKFGGLSYEVLANPQTDVYIIKTEQFGKAGIYAPKDNDSSITSSPLY